VRELWVRGVWGQGALACIDKFHQSPWFHRFQEQGWQSPAAVSQDRDPGANL